MSSWGHNYEYVVSGMNLLGSHQEVETGYKYYIDFRPKDQ